MWKKGKKEKFSLRLGKNIILEKSVWGKNIKLLLSNTENIQSQTRMEETSQQRQWVKKKILKEKMHYTCNRAALSQFVQPGTTTP